MTHKLKPEDQLNFILGGHALFTIKNTITDGRFTYKVEAPHGVKPEESNVLFVKVLTGPENTRDYRYIGYIKNSLFIHGGLKAKVGKDAQSVIAFDFIFNRLLTKGFNKPNLEVWHEGKCARCGRTLTVPESIENGIGPECAKIQAFAHVHNHA